MYKQEPVGFGQLSNFLDLFEDAENLKLYEIEKFDRSRAFEKGKLMKEYQFRELKSLWSHKMVAKAKKLMVRLGMITTN